MRRISGQYSSAYSWAELILNGVIFVNGANEHNCCIDSETKIGAGTQIGPGVILDGETTIGKNCIIGVAGITVIERSIIGDNVKIKHTCGIRDCEIGDDTNISEFVSIANLVGGGKHKTKIGSRCMIGIHVSIMGGAEIGNECYIADNARVSALKLLPRTYFNPGRSVSNRSYPPYLNNGSWYLDGNYLALNHPISQDARASFYVKAFHKCGQNGNAMKEWLKTPKRHMSGRTPIERIQKDGEKSFACLLGECGTSEKPCIHN